MASEATELVLSDEDFEDIRPYQDSEVPEVIRRLENDKELSLIHISEPTRPY